MSDIPPLLWGLPRQMIQPNILEGGGGGNESRGNLCALTAVMITALG